MDFWTRGVAPTLEEFAGAWTKAKAAQHRLLRPEYCLSNRLAAPTRQRGLKEAAPIKATSALTTLEKIAPRGI
jgi:hypothetical protein